MGYKGGFKSRYYSKYKRGKKKGYPNMFGTKPKFMPSRLKMLKANQLDTKTFYFKNSGTINSNNAGQSEFFWQTLVPDPAVPGTLVFPNVADYLAISSAYQEYRCLAIKITLFAANVGTEVGQITAGIDTPGYNRGNTVVYCDQDVKPSTTIPEEITDLINIGSAKMIPSRVSKFSYTIYRAKGHPEWGTCNLNLNPDDRTPDSWWGAIFLRGQYARIGVGVRPLWFWRAAYKVEFRGRNQTQ